MSRYQFERIGNASVCTTLNDSPAARPMTVPIVGIPRGGTTMVAAVVEALGVHLGPREELDRFHFEDQTMHSPYLDLVHRCIQQRNAAFDVWGWKDPVGISSVRQTMFALRSPRIIVIFRDMLASIQGEMRFDAANGIEPARSFAALAEKTLQWWKDNFDYLGKTQLPTLLVSYERAMAMPDQFIAELSAFLGFEPSDSQVVEARSRISAGGYIVGTQ